MNEHQVKHVMSAWRQYNSGSVSRLYLAQVMVQHKVSRTQLKQYIRKNYGLTSSR